jgi:adenylate cyclase
MAQKTNSFERFWKELKRHKVLKVIAMYAGTAFILLQLAKILTPASLLPAWTARLVTLILIIGFPLAMIFSWIFEFTPEGLNKTVSIEAVKKKEFEAVSGKRRIKASDIIITAMAITIVILIIC